jgi:hypothetical protein
MKNVHRILVGISEDKGPLTRTGHRWEGSIEMKGTGREVGHWIQLVQDRVKFRPL